MTPSTAQADPRPMLWASSWLVFIAMLSSFTPTPLYTLYQERWGMTTAWVSAAFAAYPIGVLVVLVALGGLSDRWGRRPTLLLASVVIGISLLTLAFAVTPGLVVLGRVLQGFGTALTTGAAAAALMELHPKGVQAGSVLNTVSLSIGCAIGPYAAGFLAERSDYPTAIPYLGVALLLVVPGFLLVRMPKDERVLAGARLLRRVRVPARLARPFLAAALAVVITNLSMGIYGSFGSDLAAAVGLDGRAAAGRLVSIVFVALAGAQILGRKWTTRTSIAVGSVSCLGGWSVTAMAMYLSNPAPVAVGAVLLGAGAGLTLMGSASLIGSIAPAYGRAELYSAYLCVAFAALGVIALLAGWALAHLTLATFISVVAVAVGVLAVAEFLISRNLLMDPHA